MAKSYKIATVQKFDIKIGPQPVRVGAQYSLPQVPESPQTIIYKSRDVIKVEDFESLAIEHEHEVRMPGRVNDMKFERYIRKGFINGYKSDEKNLLLMSGKKDDILSFCRYTRNVPQIRISTLRIDMKALLARLAEVKLVWFRFPAGMIHASALMGDHLEKTSAFKQAKSEAEISTLSFYFEDSNGRVHPLMVTGDGAVVVQDPYEQVATELELVLSIKEQLLDGIYLEEPIIFKAPSK
jgi:hypothetical protein